MASKLENEVDHEKLLYENIQKANVGDVIRVLNEGKIRVDCVDDHGMTPLQHAAYRGNRELCEVLLDRGADVNSNKHEHGYTALMFAALSGSVAVTSLLLAAGASMSAVNTVGRSAAQMAAFVGNHECVSVMNNFVPLSQLEYYAEVHGLEAEPKLPRGLVKALHCLLSKPNVHPVAVALFLRRNTVLLDGADRVAGVLRLMCEKEVKKAEANEVLALKYHFLAYTVDGCRKMTDTLLKKKSLNGAGLEPAMVLDDVAKHWLQTHKDDGSVPNALELFMREGIRQFPFPQCPIIQQLVRTVATASVGDEPSALGLVTSMVCGQRPAADDDQCATCGCRAKTCKKCSGCKSMLYCDQRCQKLHWFVHKRQCKKLAAAAAQSACRKRQEEEEEASNGTAAAAGGGGAAAAGDTSSGPATDGGENKLVADKLHDGTPRMDHSEE